MSVEGAHENPRDDPEQQPASPAPEPPVRREGRLKRMGVGALILFIFMSLLYGVTQVIQLIVFATICTAGIGLIVILFLCWLVGWVALAIWHSFREPGAARAAS